MTRTPEEFKQQALALNLSSCPVRDCSICGYPLSYQFSIDYELVRFDSGCDCTYRGSNYIESSWDAVAELYNAQSHKGVIADMNKFWGFTE